MRLPPRACTVGAHASTLVGRPLICAPSSALMPPPNSGDPSRAIRLLQALRWRLIRSHAGRNRSGVLLGWFEVDLLRVNAPAHEQILPLLACSGEVSTQPRAGWRWERERGVWLRLHVSKCRCWWAALASSGQGERVVGTPRLAAIVGTS
eukprot:357900-Chlamydomonas_euryale.AAC.2